MEWTFPLQKFEIIKMWNLSIDYIAIKLFLAFNVNTTTYVKLNQYNLYAHYKYALYVQKKFLKVTYDLHDG